MNEANLVRISKPALTIQRINQSMHVMLRVDRENHFAIIRPDLLVINGTILAARSHCATFSVL